MPKENTSLAAALGASLSAAGFALSGILSGQALQLNLINKKWTLLSNSMTEYDGLLIISCAMIILFIVTLGLIPSIKIKTGIIPMNKL